MDGRSCYSVPGCHEKTVAPSTIPQQQPQSNPHSAAVSRKVLQQHIQFCKAPLAHSLPVHQGIHDFYTYMPDV